MAKKNIRNLGRRGLAMVMTLVMTISMLQLQVFAAGYEDQTMDGWYQLNEDGTVADTTTEGTHTDHGFTLSKTIAQTGENTFDITLKVMTSETVTTDSAAIQIVVDLSNSMKYCADCGNTDANDCGCGAGTRMEAVKEAIAGTDGFLDSLVADNSGKLYVSVIWFATKAGTTIGWTDISTADGLKDVKDAVENMELPGGQNGGTNLEAGLQLARNRLTMEAIATAGSKYTVLLTDGEPTYRTISDPTSTLSVTSYTYDEDKQNASTKEIEEAVEAAEEVKALSDLYTICYGVADNSLYNGAACKHCGLTQGEHEAVRVRTGWGRYHTYYYCKDAQGNRLNTVYAATAVTIGQFLADDIATEASGQIVYSFNAADTDEVNAAFADIAQSSTAGMSGSGTAVTDPMGTYIVLGDVEDLAEDGLTASGGTITWALDPANASKKTVDNVTTYTYEITYPITLDTAAAGFREGVYYPTNEYTYLTVPTADGSVKIPFNVPGVCGKLPEVDWKIEYYLQKDAEAGDYENYTLDDSDSDGPVKVWSTVSAPEGYADKYAEAYYTFVSGQTQMQITPTGENVMRLYYDHITAPVTVNHYYKTDIILPTGEEVPGAYSTTPDKTGTTYVRVNTDFQVVPETIYGGFQYTLEQFDPDLEITVALGTENVINLYYTRLDDQRVITSARVDHVYNDYTYELNNGKYELVQTGSVTETAEQAAEVRATTIFNVSPNPLAGYKAYEINEDLGDYADLLQDDGTLNFVVAEAPKDNVRTLVFEKVTDPRKEIEVTVNHYYTKSVTTVENGQVVTTVDPGNELGKSENFTAYVGEEFTAVEINGYQGEEYVSDPGNAAKLYIDSLSGDVTIDLYYDLVKTPVPVGITVNHYWRTFTEVTVEETKDVTDPETGEVTTVVTGTRVEIRKELDHSVKDITVSGLYEQQEYTAPKMSGGEGYTFNEDESNPTIIVGDKWVIDMYYDRYEQDDERSDADIDVIHNYVTYLTTVIDGEVQTIEVKDGSEQEQFSSLKAGGEFTAVPVPEYKGNTYTRITDDADLSVILQPGTNATIIIDYERKASDLVDTSYVVNYEYRTYNMTVDANGVAGYWEAHIVEAGQPVSGAGYVGQKVSLNSGDKEGFAPLTTNPATTQILAESGNEWTFIHERYIPLEQGTVTVNHHYKTTTIAIDGTSSISESSVLGAPVTKYLGETVLTEYVPHDFELVDSQIDVVSDAEPRAEIQVTVAGDTVVDFYYEKVIDNSILTQYTIAHIYKLYTWDGELISTTKPTPASGTGYVTTIITAAPEPNDYTMVESTYNGDPLDEPYTITLQEDGNDIVFVYEKYLPRELLDVKVIHNYYADEADVGVEAPLSVFEQTVTEIPEDSEYTADKRVMDGYFFYSADPESCTITVLKDGENVIVLNYVRQTARYEVIHEYYCNDELEGYVSSGEISGYVGDKIKGDSITRITSYDGNEYQFVNISEDITLEADVVKTITLTYKRTVYIPPAEHGITVEKTSSVDSIKVGEQFSYTITVKSTGDAVAANVVVTDNLPEGVELADGSGKRELSWNFGDMVPGEEKSVAIEVVGTKAGTVKNVAVVTADKDLEDQDDATTDITEIEEQRYPLVIRKKLDGNRADRYVENTFTFTITGEGVEQSVAIKGEGAITVELPDGTYTVTESDGYDLSNYKSTTVNGTLSREFTFEMTETGMEIEFINRYNRSRTPDPKPDPDPTPDPDPIPEPTPDSEPLPDPDPIEIPDEDVPLAELPEEPIPLAEVPETGEKMIYRVLAAMSGLTLAGLVLTGRRKDEEMA